MHTGDDEENYPPKGGGWGDGSGPLIGKASSGPIAFDANSSFSATDCDPRITILLANYIAPMHQAVYPTQNGYN